MTKIHVTHLNGHTFVEKDGAPGRAFLLYTDPPDKAAKLLAFLGVGTWEHGTLKVDAGTYEV